MIQVKLKFSVFHPQGIQDRSISPQKYGQYRPCKVVFDSADYFQGQHQILEFQKSEQAKVNIIMKAEAEQSSEAQKKYCNNNSSQRITKKKNSLIQLSKKNEKQKQIFDSADYFIKKELHDKKKNKNKKNNENNHSEEYDEINNRGDQNNESVENDKNNNNIEEIIMSQSENCKNSNICGEKNSVEKMFLKDLERKKSQGKSISNENIQFDSAEYFMQQQSLKNVTKIKENQHQDNNLDNIIKQQSQRCEIEHVVNKKSVVKKQLLENQRKKEKFDSADYFLKQYNEQQQLKNIKTDDIKEYYIEIEKSEEQVQNSEQNKNIYQECQNEKILRDFGNEQKFKKKVLLANIEPKKSIKYKFDSAEYFLSQQKNKNLQQNQ